MPSYIDLLLFLSLLLVCAALVALRWDNLRRGLPAGSFSSPAPERWSLGILLVASFLTLFAQLAFIRWIAVEVRFFAYFKNLALLVCFLGFGLGCALARSRVRTTMAGFSVLLLLLLVRIPVDGRTQFYWELSRNLGAAADLNLWDAHGETAWVAFLASMAMAGLLLLLLALVFIPLGQLVSRHIDLAPRTLRAYSWNLAASLGGIIGFFVVCRFMLPPSYWLAAVLAGLALLPHRWAERGVLASLIVPALVLLHDFPLPNREIVWTPYQQIEYKRSLEPGGVFESGTLWVNHSGYQTIVNLSPEFVRQRPHLVREDLRDNPYNLAFRFAAPAGSVLVVGSGTGNDVAGALRNGSSSVDAVEIDPFILELGRREHPERPYDSPRTSTYVTDARAFLKRTARHYDLILFGLLDAHTQFSDYTNMRIDNFVYTEESFREAKARLKPDGILFVKFEVQRAWLGQRLYTVMQKVFGKPPLAFMAHSSYSANASVFVISPSARVEQALADDPALAAFVASSPPKYPYIQNSDVVLTTDDWPYLYHEGRWIPGTYYAITALVMMLAIVLVLQIPEARRQRPSVFYFAMGAGFLLLEVQIISRLALYFGTTWQVAGIVIAALLITLLLANATVENFPRVVASRPRVVAGLLSSLVFAYVFPFHLIPWHPTITGSLAAVIFSLPVFFAGLLFAVEFRSAKSPSAALGANILGAMAGGLLENLSFLYGMRALLTVTAVLYAIAAVSLLRGTLPAPAAKAARLAGDV